VDPETSTQVPEKGISDRDMVLLSERDMGKVRRRLRFGKSRGSSPKTQQLNWVYTLEKSWVQGVHKKGKGKYMGGVTILCVGGSAAAADDAAAFQNSCCRHWLSFSVTSSAAALISQDIIIIIIIIISIISLSDTLSSTTADDRLLGGNYRYLSSPLISQPQYLSIHWPKSRHPKVEIPASMNTYSLFKIVHKCRRHAISSLSIKCACRRINHAYATWTRGSIRLDRIELPWLGLEWWGGLSGKSVVLY